MKISNLFTWIYVTLFSLKNIHHASSFLDAVISIEAALTKQNIYTDSNVVPVMQEKCC